MGSVNTKALIDQLRAKKKREVKRGRNLNLSDHVYIPFEAYCRKENVSVSKYVEAMMAVVLEEVKRGS